MKRHIRHTIPVLTAYLLLTILMTWPMARHLTAAIPGDGFDGWQNYWNLWWVKQSLLNLGVTPFFTDYLYPPTGVSLLFHTLNIFNAMWTLPLQLNFGLALAYNSVVFASFTLAGYGGYLLSLHTLSRLNLSNKRGLRPAAFVGGLVFTMSPFHMAHLLGHMQVFSMIWPPFYILWLLRTLEPWASPAAGQTSPPAARRTTRNAAITCLFLILATLVDWYHTLYLLIFTGLVLLWTVVRQGQALSRQKDRLTETPPVRFRLDALRPLLQPIWAVLAIGLGFGLALSPLLVPMIRAARARPDLDTGLLQNVTLSADLLAFITPSEMHPLWGEWAANIAGNFSSTTSERLIFAGFIPLALALFIAVRGWSNLMVKFWAMMTAVFFVLALGPYLHIAGQIVTLGGRPIPLPYLLLYRTVPFIGLTRSLSRYDLMVMLGLGVLVALALVQLMTTVEQTGATTRRPSKVAHPTRFWLPPVAALLICFEFLPTPYPISRIDTPPFYFDLSAEPGDFTIAELPMNWDRPTPLLHQTTHGKRLLTAYTSRNNPLELAWRTPVLQHWRYLSPDIIDQPLAEIAPTIFFDFNLRYIVLDYWQMPPGPERDATEQWVAAALPGAAPIYDDGRLKVYRSPSRQEIRPYLSVGNGWSDRQDDTAGPLTRTFAAAGSQPELFLHHPQDLSLELEITAAANLPQNLTLLVDGRPGGQVQVGQTVSTQTIALPRQTGSLVKLSFLSDTPSGHVSVSRIGLREAAGRPE